MTEPGQEFGGVVRALDQETIAGYAKASGDDNPIHIDTQFAAQTPFGGTIAHGMLLLAYIGEMMAGQFAMAWLQGSTLKVRFREPARPGDHVTTRGRVERLEDDPAGGKRAVCSVECLNERGDVLVSGEARVKTASE